MNRKMVSRLVLTVLLVNMLTLAHNIKSANSSEPPPTKWSKTYGKDTFNEAAYSIIQAIDGGYVLTGFTENYSIMDAWDFWLVKTDANGNMEWNQTYGCISHDTAKSIIQTSDGGYALIGYTASVGAGETDAWLVKTDSTGIMQWNQT
jgi:hypothetical protein